MFSLRILFNVLLIGSILFFGSFDFDEPIKTSKKNLLKTVKTVQQFARKHNYSIDLHRGNYMQRPDGTIVVNDPFVIWERNL